MWLKDKVGSTHSFVFLGIVRIGLSTFFGVLLKAFRPIPGDIVKFVDRKEKSDEMK